MNPQTRLGPGAPRCRGSHARTWKHANPYAPCGYTSGTLGQKQHRPIVLRMCLNCYGTQTATAPSATTNRNTHVHPRPRSTTNCLGQRWVWSRHGGVSLRCHPVLLANGNPSAVMLQGWGIMGDYLFTIMEDRDDGTAKVALSGSKYEPLLSGNIVTLSGRRSKFTRDFCNIL